MSVMRDLFGELGVSKYGVREKVDCDISSVKPEESNVLNIRLTVRLKPGEIRSTD